MEIFVVDRYNIKESIIVTLRKLRATLPVTVTVIDDDVLMCSIRWRIQETVTANVMDVRLSDSRPVP